MRYFDLFVYLGITQLLRSFLSKLLILQY